jgi:hypothetical protein
LQGSDVDARRYLRHRKSCSPSVARIAYLAGVAFLLGVADPGIRRCLDASERDFSKDRRAMSRRV